MTANASLYKLSEAYTGVMLRLDANEDGEIPADLDADLDAIQDAIETKVENICRFRADLVAHAEAIDSEIKRLTAMRDGMTRRAEWLKQYVFTSMLGTGTQKLQTPLFKLWIQRNSQPSVTMAGETIPDEFKREKIVVELDRAKVLEAFDAGQELPSVLRVIHGSHLRIK